MILGIFLAVGLMTASCLLMIAIGIKDGPGAMAIGIFLGIFSALAGIEIGQRWSHRQEKRRKE